MRSKLLFLTVFLFFLNIVSLDPAVGSENPQEIIEELESVNQFDQQRETETPERQGEEVATPDQSGVTETTGEDEGSESIVQPERVTTSEGEKEVEETNYYRKLEPQDALETFIKEGCSTSLNVMMQLDEKARGNAISYCDYKESSQKFLALSPDIFAILVTLAVFIITEFRKWQIKRGDRKNDFRLKAADIIIKTASNNTLDAKVKLETLKKLFNKELSDLVIDNLFNIQYQQTYDALQALAEKNKMTDHRQIDNIVGGYIRDNLINN